MESIRKVLESGEVERDEEFLLSIWDCPDQFQLHLSELGSAIQSNSLDAAAYRDRGYDYYMIRQFELAFSDFQTAHRLDDSNPAALDWSAFLAVHLGKHEYAVEAYERLNELEPNDSSNIGTLLNQILELSRLKNKANSEAAKEVEQDASEVATLGALCDQYIQINPFCHNAMIVKARVHNHIGNTELAYETIKQVLVYHPDCKHGHLVAMAIAQNRNEFEQADAYWTCYKAIMEKESKSLRKSTLTSGVVISTSVDLDKVTLHILYSPDAKTERLNAIAFSLIQKFDFADDHHNYWRAVCQLGTEQEETVALPRTVATNLGFDSTRLYLEIISLPRRHFHGSASTCLPGQTGILIGCEIGLCCGDGDRIATA